MHIIVVGAGISGLLSAYYLLQRGYQVTIIESSSDVAAKASGANASQLSYSYVNPIGSPSLKYMLPRIIFGKMPGFQIKHLTLETVIWGIKLLRQSSSSNFIRNRSQLLALSLKSRQLFGKIRNHTEINFANHSRGKLQIFHTQALEESASIFSEELKHHQLSQKLLDLNQCESLLGDFNIGKNALSASYSKIDETADCRIFCHDLLEHLKGNTQFAIHFNTQLEKWQIEDGLVIGQTNADNLTHKADIYLLCTGVQTNALVQSIGLKFPIYPVKGYTLVYETDTYLPCSITDHEHKVVFVPQNGQILVSGMFYIGGRDNSIDDDAVANIHQYAISRIPSLNYCSYEVRYGLRPCTPNSLPIIQHTKYSNLFINSGHGMYGWTLSPACAENAATLIDNYARTHKT
ncbi:MAG: FAD-dependent oxidoreductase [Pseudomonadota bacterium]